MSIDTPSQAPGKAMTQAFVVAFVVIVLTVFGINYIDPNFPGMMFNSKGP